MPDINATYDINIAKVQAAFATVETMGKRAAAAVNSAGAGGAFRAQRAGAQKAAQTFAVVKKEADAAGAAANRAGGAVNGFGAKVRRAGTAAAAISAIIVALVALNRRFPVIGQVASKSFAVIKQTAQQAMITTGKFAVTLNNLKAAAGAAVGIYTLAKAFKALRGSAAGTENIKVPKVPTGGGGMGLGAKAGIAGLALGGIGLAGMAFSAVKDVITKAVTSAGEAEQIEISFEVLAGGAAPAKKLLGEIRQLAKDTPLSFGDLAGAGSQLAAFKEPLNGITDTLRRIGDISSGIRAPIGEIAEIYGKARVQGTLFAADINQLTGRGIDVITEFANQLGVGTDQVKEMGSEGKITSSMLEKAFQSLTNEGGLFYEMNAKQSKTMVGLWSTLKDNVAEAFKGMGKPINNALKPILEKAIELAERLPDLFARIGDKVSDVVNFIHAAFRTLSGGAAIDLIGAALQVSFLSALDVLHRGIQAAWNTFADVSFMDALSSKMIEVGAVLKHELLSAIEAMLMSLSEMSGLEFLSDAALDVFNQKVANTKEEFDRKAKEGEQKTDFTDEFKAQYENAVSPFAADLAKQKAAFTAGIGPVWEEAKRLKAEQTAMGEDDPGNLAKVGEMITGAAKGAGRAAGAFQQAKNLISGKTVNEIVAQETALTNKKLDQLNSSARAIEKAVKDNGRKPDKQKPTVVKVVPTF